MSELLPLLRYIGPLVLFVCFLPFLVSRFKQRDDSILVKLNKQLDPELYHLNTDVEIRTKEQSVDIKYVITSKFGIFVVDVRPFVGLVEGQPNHVMWSSKSLGKKRRFSNPLKYNKEAVNVLRSRYDFEPSAYHSLVVFKGKGKFAGTMPNNVRTQNDFIEYILSKDTELLQAKDVQRVHTQIRDGAIPNTLKTYSQYLDRAKELVDEYSVVDKGNKSAGRKVKDSSGAKLVEQKKNVEQVELKRDSGLKKVFRRTKKVSRKKKAVAARSAKPIANAAKNTVVKKRVRRRA